MGRKRDARTGFYISDEEAATKDRSTWVEESESTHKKRERQTSETDERAPLKKVLEDIYNELYEESTVPGNWTFPVVAMKQVKAMFNKYGADITDNRA